MVLVYMYAQRRQKPEHQKLICLPILSRTAVKLVFCALILSPITSTMADVENVAKVTKSSNDFATNMYDILAKQGGSSNVFFSPISIHTILSLLYQGAEEESATLIEKALYLNNKQLTANGYKGIMETLNTIENVTLHMANKVYVQSEYKLKESFEKTAVESFSAEAQNLNFADNMNSAKIINDWVELKTKDKIKDLIQPDDLNALTRLVLVNAIYFKGNWAKQFKKELTKVENFYTSLTDSVDCNMMHINGKYRYAEVDALGAKMLEMPYTNPNVSMLFILPNARDGIKDLEQKLANFDLNTAIDKMMPVTVDVSLPKFKVETTIDLDKPLKQLGLADLFTTKANLSGLLDSPESLYISKAIQKAFIEVNEEGAEAAAATGVVSRRKRCIDNDDSIKFIVDKPCLIIVKCRINVPLMQLFYGKLTTPDLTLLTFSEVHEEL